MTLQTNLSVSPYFDDYQSNSSYYRVLFKPSVAVQTRELNQVQSILQNQISLIGDNVFQDGSIINGCTFTFNNNWQYVKLSDTYSNNSLLDVNALNGLTCLNSSNLQATVVFSDSGYISQSPNTNTIYVRYINSSVFSNGSPQTAFQSNDLLTFVNSSNTVIGQAYVVSNTSYPAVGNVTGNSYGLSITSGIVLKDGIFMYVPDQTITVNRYSNFNDGISIGFNVNSSIDTASSNSSLYDNAAGSPNYQAPGADRLKLVPYLSVVNTSSISNNSGFYSLVDFKNGSPVTIRQVAALSNTINSQLAERTFETNGNFIVNPFLLSTAPIANTANTLYANNVNLVTSSGIGYVRGYRVEFVNNNYQILPRATTTALASNQIVSANFGYYLTVQEVSGEFGSSTTEAIQVELHSQPLYSVTNGTLLSTVDSSATIIGYAYMRGFEFASGTPGLANSQYYAYPFGIQMNPGYSFTSVKSIIYNNGGTVTGCADIVLQYNAALNANVAVLQQPFNNGLIYPLGQRAISTNMAPGQFVYRQKNSGTFGTAGSANVQLKAIFGSATEQFNYSGTLSSTQEQDVYVVITTQGITANQTGSVAVTASSNVVVGSGTNFLVNYAVGDYISVNSAKGLITFIANATYLTTANTFSSTNSSSSHQKLYPVGSTLAFSNRGNRSISISGNTMTLSFATSTEYPTSSFNFDVFYSVNRSNATPINKVINHGTYIKIDCSNNSAGFTGPWCLGVPDTFSLDAVYIGNNHTYANTGTNYANYFTLDNGQRDSHYGLSYLSANQSALGTLINSNATILVQVSNFTYGTAGYGFFSANSYPIDDANTANTNAIRTAQIPIYTTKKGTAFDLRDSIDFRPYAVNTATSNTNYSIASASINPANTLTFGSSGYFIPTPDSNFEASINYYLPRTDLACLDTGGNLIVVQGIPAVVNPIAPMAPIGTMTLGTINVPPYPSLSTPEAAEYNRYDYAITTSMLQNKRYTMSDISGLDNRIHNLEYYTSLSLLEQSTSSLLTRSSVTGSTRFQNGIFVDPFNGFDLSNTLNPQFYISIDSNNSQLRPAFTQLRSTLSFNNASSLNNGVQQHGNLIMLPHTSNNLYQIQPNATSYRNCQSGAIYDWVGTLTLTPPGTLSPDTSVSPQITNNIDLASNWINLANAWGTQWGNWVDTATSTSIVPIAGSTTSSSVTNPDGSQSITNVTQALQTTTATQTQTGTQLTVSNPSTNQLNLGNFVTNISILPYLKAATINFAAHGMKPNTRVYAYFSNTPVTSYCVPTDSSGNPLPGYTLSNGVIISNSPTQYMTTDTNGNIYGIFYLPANTFKAQDNIFMINDISDLSQGSNAIQTQSSTTFYGSNLSVSQGQSILSTQNVVVNTNEVTQQQQIQSSASIVPLTTYSYMPPPPPVVVPPFGGGGCGCGSIICTKLYGLGLMSQKMYEIDVQVGEIMRAKDPEAYNGYLNWASVVIEWMSGNPPIMHFWIRDKLKRRKLDTEFTIKVTKRIVHHWAMHMAHMIDNTREDDTIGAKVMSFGRWISRKINSSNWFNKYRKTKIVQYSMILMFLSAYSLIAFSEYLKDKRAPVMIDIKETN